MELEAHSSTVGGAITKQQNTRRTAMEYSTIISLDVSDKTSKVCIMSKIAGRKQILEETTIYTTKDALLAYLKTKNPTWPVVFETGTHCRWMEKVVKSLGMKPIVANPAHMRMVTESNTKNDRNDARELAKIALADVELLHPVSLRSEICQQMLRLLKARDVMISVRTKFVNQLRGFGKSMGFRLPSCSANKVYLLDKSQWPEDFETVAWPIMDILETIEIKIKAYESQIKKLASCPELKDKIERVREVYGIGLLSGCALVASIDADPDRFSKARDAGAYFGVVPKQRQSGEMDMQCHITLSGSEFVRNLMVESAQIALRESARDTDIKLKGLRICQRGGKIAKKKAIIAVARCLIVTAVALLKHPERKYIPLSEKGRVELEAMRMIKAVA
jgi:transposase